MEKQGAVWPLPVRAGLKRKMFSMSLKEKMWSHTWEKDTLNLLICKARLFTVSPKTGQA